MFRRIPLTGAVVVSTPQDVALNVAQKAIYMFNQLNFPVLGIVENMSYYRCHHCGERARKQYFVGYPPSSPCTALFREGRLVHMIQRHQIEGQSTEVLTKILRSAYDKYCGEEIDESVDIYDPVAELQITVEEARERIPTNSELVFLDVREPNEIERGKIEGALEVNNELGQTIVNSWPRDREIIVYYEHGERSLKATQFLKQQGFENVRSLRGGFAGWSASNLSL